MRSARATTSVRVRPRSACPVSAESPRDSPASTSSASRCGGGQAGHGAAVHQLREDEVRPPRHLVTRRRPAGSRPAPSRPRPPRRPPAARNRSSHRANSSSSRPRASGGHAAHASIIRAMMANRCSTYRATGSTLRRVAVGADRRRVGLPERDRPALELVPDLGVAPVRERHEPLQPARRQAVEARHRVDGRTRRRLLRPRRAPPQVRQAPGRSRLRRAERRTRGLPPG